MIVCQTDSFLCSIKSPFDMNCPNCGNFVAYQAIGGMCHWKCISCGSTQVQPGLVIHASARGTVPKVGGTGDITQETVRLAENLSYEKTLLRLNDAVCPECKSPLTAWLRKDNTYTFICPKHRDIRVPT